MIATRAYSCYKTIFEHNVVHFGKGKLLGAVNGYRPSKRVDDSCIQSREVWPGTTYGLAAAMILESGVTLEFQQKSEEAISLKLPSDLYETDDLTHDQRNDLFHMAMKTAEGIYNAGWVEFGYWYTTPEAWERDGAYRSKGYMRPLSVWAMQSAIEKFQK